MDNIFEDIEKTEETIKETTQIIEPKKEIEKKVKIPEINFDDLDDLEVEEQKVEEKKVQTTKVMPPIPTDSEEDIDSEKLKKFTKNGVNKVEFHKKLVYINKEEYDKLEDLKNYDNISLNAIINEAIKNYTKKRKRVLEEISKVKEEE